MRVPRRVALLTSELRALPGAVAGRPPDEGVAAHYGDPLGEQRVLESGRGFVDRSNRGVLRVSGADRLSWLHSLTTQHLERLGAWQPVEGLVLSPHGHVEHHFGLVDDGAACWLDVEPGTAALLAGYLDSMRFMLRVEVTDVSAEWAVLTATGTEDRAGGDGASALPGGGFRRARRWPVASADLLVPRTALAQVARGLGSACGLGALEALRVAHRVPRLGFETDHRTIPHEVGWIGPAVHLDKGCYRGQETVARVQNLGRPPRRLVLLQLDGSDERLPEHGDPIEVDGRAVGFVGTAAWHYEFGPVALGLIKRAVADDADLLAGGVPARIDPEPEGRESRARS